VRHTVIAIVAIGVLTIAAFDLPIASGHASRTGGQSATIKIPESLRTEHQAIHRALVEATKAPGRVGAAANQLEAVLGPHFKREEEIALPPLGLLAALAAGERPAGMEEALAMSEALRQELPRMLEEHKQIRAATEKLRTAARDEKATVHEQFAEELAAHPQGTIVSNPRGNGRSEPP
jgi:hypothetical protein